MRSSTLSPRAAATWSLLVTALGCGGANDASVRSGGNSEAIATNESALVDGNYTLDTNPDLPNPERGVSYWQGGTAPDPHTVENHFLWLGDFCDVDLVWQGRTSANTSAVLKTWADAAVLQVRDVGRKVIFRPRYDTPAREGNTNKCGKVEGNSYAQMQRHVQVIASMLADPEIKPVVAFVEIGYLGSWGEWNTAGTSCGSGWSACQGVAPVLVAGAVGQDRITFAKYVIDTYRAAGITRPVGLRRPEFYKDADFNYGVAVTSMGFYNDCFMNSADDTGSDGGTFSRFESDYGGTYPELYPNSVLSTVTAAKQYMRANVTNGSQGGENCSPISTAQWKVNPSSVPGRMDADGFHYFKPGTRDAGDFRQTMMDAADASYGTIWNHIKSRLGYRFHAKQVSYPSTVTPGASMTIGVDLENSGFNKIPNDRTAHLVLRSASASYVVGTSNPKAATYGLITPTAQSNSSARNWAKGVTTTFSQTFPAPPAGTYSVHLYVPDPDCIGSLCSSSVQANYAVRLATKRNGNNVFDSSGTGLNDLGVSFTVAAAPTYTLSVRTYNQANSAEITGLWTVVTDSGGTQRTGYSPITFTIPGGSTSVSVGDFQQYTFDHWENGATTRPRIVNLTTNTSVSGYYAVSP